MITNPAMLASLWLPFSEPSYGVDDCLRADARVRRVIQSWEDVPRMGGGAITKDGTDCYRFPWGFFAEMDGGGLELPPDMPTRTDPDMDRATFARYVGCFYRRFGAPRSDLTCVQPGDLVVMGKKGPEHLGLVGCRAGEIWHCTDKVIRGHVANLDVKYLRVYRVTRRTW